MRVSAHTSAHPYDHSRNVGAGPALVTLLAIQIIIGYEWLASGVTKVASGTFVSGLAADLTDQSKDASHWYRTFLDSSIIPNARTFAVLIEVGEVLVGVAFIVAAIVWLTHWSHLSDRWRMTVLGATMLSAFAATLMAVNFHLAAGANHPWLIPADGFNETIDVDMVLAFIQAAFFIFSGYLILKIRREAGDSPANGARVPADNQIAADDEGLGPSPNATEQVRGSAPVAQDTPSSDTERAIAHAIVLTPDNEDSHRQALSDRHDRTHLSSSSRFLLATGVAFAAVGAVGRLVRR